MVTSFFKSSRSVLLIGDEALYIYNVTARRTKLVDVVPWQADGFEATVARRITKDCGGKPVLLVNDMTDQHFKGGQRLPKVGIMDKANVLQRRLTVAFPNYPIRGALRIKDAEKSEKATSGRTVSLGDLYLFSAVPMSEAVAKTIAAVKKSMAPIAGFVLLPIESSDMVAALSKKVVDKKTKVAKWSIFIGQHQSGALRQVITRNGQLAMTRMTPVINDDSDPAVWAREVAQEFKATVSYLSRFGFSPSDATDLFVVASQQAGEALEGLIDISCKYTPLTAREASKILGIDIGVQEHARYADVLHASYIGQKSRFILPMDAPELKKVHQPRQVASLAIFLLILSAGYFAWEAFGQTQEMLTKSEDLENQRRILRQAEAELDVEVERMESLGFDVRTIQAAVHTFRDIENSELKTKALIQKLDDAVGGDLKLDKVDVKLERKKPSSDNNPRNRGFAPNQDEKIEYEVVGSLRLSFPEYINLEYGIREINSLETRLKTVLPGYAIRVAKQIGNLDYGQTVSGEAGRTAEEIAEKADREAEIIIRGPLQ
jgi:hypothetical protein